MALSTLRLLDPDVEPAVGEALDNVERLYLSGYFDAALSVVGRFLRPGAWRVGTTGVLSQRIGRLLPMLCWAAGRDCPAWAGQPARTTGDLHAWAHQRTAATFSSLAESPFRHARRVRIAWDDAYLAGLPQRVATDDQQEYWRFLIDAQLFLIHRLRQRLQSGPVRPDLPVATLPPMWPDVDLDTHADAVTYRQLAGILRACLGAGAPPDYQAQRCFVTAAVLDLIDDDPDRAGMHLRWVVGDVVASLLGYLPYVWAPVRDLLATHLLAPQFAVDAAAVAAYLADLATRVPAALRARPTPDLAYWTTQLATHARALVPSSGADEASLDAAERRLGTRLPPSYRTFLQASNGLLIPTAVDLLPADDIDWFRIRNAEWLAVWDDPELDYETSDEQYFTYGPDQDSVWIRPRYLRTALQISDTAEGWVLLLNPQIRFGDEWEAWDFGTKLPGAHRYRSFADLFRDTVLA